MAQEVIYETGKRKNRAAKAGKPDEQPANQTAPDENNVGWEEQLWMNQAESTTDATAAWQPTPHSMTGMSTNAPTLDTLKEQWGQVRRQVDGQVCVVEDHEPGGAQEVGAADHPEKVAELGNEAGAGALERQHERR